MLAEYRKRRDFVIGAAARHSRRALRGAARRVLRVSEHRRGVPQRHLEQRAIRRAAAGESAVAVVPGEAFGTDRHVRISYATSMHELERGLDRLHRFIVEQ